MCKMKQKRPTKYMKQKRKRWYIGIDIGGTKVLIGLLNKQFKVCATYKCKVEPDRGEKYFIKTIVEGVEQVLSDSEVKRKQVAAVGVGCPGLIDNALGTVKLSPNISFLKNYPLKAKLASHFKVPVVVENDVNAGLYGEYQFGAARGYSHVVGIFPGTGVGGALILNKKLYHGADGGAGEIGHSFLTLPTFLSGVKYRGTVEALVGRLAIASEAATLIAKQKAPKLYKKAGYDFKKIKSNALSRAIGAGDKYLEDLILDKARILGITMANIVNILNPELIVLGGGVIEALGKLIVPEARRIMKQYAMAPLTESIKVVSAELKDYSIVLGAAKLAHDVIEDR